MDDERDVYSATFTTKELLIRMETSLNARFDQLRQEMMNAQANFVNKGELDVHLKTINRDTERIESQLRDELRSTSDRLDAKLKEYRENSQEDLKTFKNDINTSLQRTIMILGFIVTIVQVVIALVGLL